MKIALVNHTFSASHGGLERFSVNLATALCREGHEVHAFAQRLEDLPDAVFRHSITVPRKPAFWRPMRFHRSVGKVLKDEDFDIVYGLTRFFPLDVYRMGDGIQRHWLRIRHPQAFGRLLNCLLKPVHLVNLYLEKRIQKDARCHIVTNSKLCRNHAICYYGVDPQRITVIYNGVDHDTFNPEALASRRGEVRKRLGLAEEDFALIYVSNNWRRKGLAVILQAVDLLAAGGGKLQVVVVGRGKPRAFEKLADRLGVGDRLHFVGTTNRVQEYYAAGDLFVLPTLYDPFANVCLEAMACGLPVVTTAENGASELIREGQNGYIHKDATDAWELSALLARCLDREQLQAMGSKARETSLSFTRERNMRENLELFQRLMHKGEG